MRIEREKLVIEKDSEDGCVFIDLLKSNLTPGKEFLSDLLDKFYNGEIGNCYMADSCEEIWKELIKISRKVLEISDDQELHIFLTNRLAFEEEGINPSVYVNTIDWAVFNLLENASVEPLLITDIAFIREFLNCHPGQEREAFKKWHEYWSKVDFASRHDIAQM